MTLIERWRTAARGGGASADDGAVDAAGADLFTRWREPHRHYHTLEHLTAMLSIVDEYGGADPVRLAAWYHDAVYDPRAPGDANERDSAALARTALTALAVPDEVVAEVSRLVLLTADHAADPDDANGALLCDADLSILAAPPATYDRYAAAIRTEYAHVPNDVFRTARTTVLHHLLTRPAIYRLPAPSARWETPARTNLHRELNAMIRE